MSYLDIARRIMGAVPIPVPRCAISDQSDKSPVAPSTPRAGLPSAAEIAGMTPEEADAYWERVAICEHDGRQTTETALRTAWEQIRSARASSFPTVELKPQLVPAEQPARTVPTGLFTLHSGPYQ